MSRTLTHRPAFVVIACVALAAALAGGGAHAAEGDSAATTTAPAAIQCADPATSPPAIPEASAPGDPIDRTSGSALGARSPTPSDESLPWGPLILGAVALQVVASVAWTIVRHSRDG